MQTAHGSSSAPLILSAPLRCLADSDQAARNIASRDVEFAGELYTGGAVHGNLFVDLASTSVESSEIPLLLGHDTERVIGLHRVHNDGRLLRSAGRLFTRIDADARAVVEKADAGMPWQMSLGLYEYTFDEVPAGKRIVVNGRDVSGPAYVLRNGLLREGSIVSLGADRNTSAAFFSQFNPSPATAAAANSGATMIELEQAQARVAELEAANATLTQQLAELRTAVRLQDVRALFVDVGREFSDDSAKPYLSLSDGDFAALAADLRAAFKPAEGRNLPPGLTSSAFSGGAPASGADNPLLAAVKSAFRLS